MFNKMKRRPHRRAMAAAAIAAINVAVISAVAASAVAAPIAAAPSGAQAALPATATFGATNDAYVAQNAPTTNYGAETTLTATAAPGARKIVYLSFRVDTVPAGATGITATLTLHRTTHHLPADVSAWTVPNAQWSEGTINYNNAPPLGSSLGTVHPDSSSSTVTFPASNVTAGSRVYAYALTTSVANDSARFWSKESTSGPYPTLTVQYTPPDPMWIGATVTTPDKSIQSFDAANSAIGPLRYRRCFDPNLPATFQESCARDDAAHGYHSFVSWKPPKGDFVGAANGAYDTAVIRWAKSVPATGVYATAFHEPENDMTGPQFVAMQCHLYQVVKTANPSIRWGSVYMAYWWDPARLPTIGGAAAWWVGSSCADFTGVDTYAANPTTLTSRSPFRGWYDFMLDKGTPMLIVEYGQGMVPFGTTPDPAKLAARAATINADAAWLRGQGVIKMWLYWDGTGKKGDWNLTDPASQKAWRDVAAAGRVS
jgi:hypothetical protein